MNKNNFFISILSENKKELIIKSIQLIILVIVISVIDVGIPYTLKLLFDEGIQKENFQIFTFFILFTIGLYVFKAILNIVCNKLYVTTSNFIVEGIEKSIFWRLLRMPLSFYDKYGKGYILARMNEVEKIGILFSPSMLKVLINCISLIGAIIMIGLIEFRIIIILLLMVPFLYFFSKNNTIKLNQSMLELREAVANKLNILQIDINAVQDIKQLNIEYVCQNNYNDFIHNNVEKNIEYGNRTSIGNEGITLFAAVANVLVIFFIGIMMINQDLGTGDYIALTSYVGKILYPIHQVAALSITIQPALLSLKRMDFFYKNLIEDENKQGIKVGKITKIEFKNVKFTYPETSKVVLDNVSFEVQKGEKIVLSGENGSGKTTISKLLLRFYHNYQGEILINEKELRMYDTGNIRSKIGIISQKTELFPGTIEDNIIAGRPGIDAAKLQHVIEICDLQGTIEWAHKYNFRLSANANNLSGGQIQRLAIARAIISDPDVLILDEVNNNLDDKAQNMILDLVDKHLSDAIVFIITHDNKMKAKGDQLINLS